METQRRSDPYRYRNFLDPLVYRDLITQVVFLGAPSTGKTTLAAALAQEHQTVWVPEYGREYWEKHQVDRRLTQEQLLEIAVEHRRREEAQWLSANRYLFIDTDATTTRQFSLYYHDACDERLERLAGETLQRYDLFFLCLPDIPYDDTWDRSGAVFREVFQRRIEADLIARRIPYTRLGGPLHERIARVNQVLADMPPPRPPRTPR